MRQLAVCFAASGVSGLSPIYKSSSIHICIVMFFRGNHTSMMKCFSSLSTSFYCCCFVSFEMLIQGQLESLSVVLVTVMIMVMTVNTVSRWDTWCVCVCVCAPMTSLCLGVRTVRSNLWAKRPYGQNMIFGCFSELLCFGVAFWPQARGRLLLLSPARDRIYYMEALLFSKGANMRR